MTKAASAGGFFQLDYEHVAGLMGTPATTGLRGVVVFEVWAQVCGWAKKTVAELHPADIARRMNLRTDKCVSRAIAELVRFKVLIKCGPSQYALEMNCSQYDFPHRQVVNEDRVRYAKNAPTLVRSHKKFDDNPRVRGSQAQPHSGDSSATASVAVVLPQRSANATAMVAESLPNDAAPSIRNAHAELKNFEKEQLQQEGRRREIAPEDKHKEDLIAEAHKLRPKDDAKGRVGDFVSNYGLEATRHAFLAAKLSVKPWGNL